MKTEKADVAVMTVKPPELMAAKIAFGIDLKDKEDNYINGLRYWNKVISDASGRPMDVVVTMVGESGSDSCAAACDRLFNAYDVGLCILVGIAAGLKGKVSLGDVVTADIILDYESARLDADGLKKRPNQYSPDTQIGRDLEYFDPAQHEWHNSLSEEFEKLKNFPCEVPKIEGNWLPKYIPGVILSGEKLIADGHTIDDKRQEYHDRIRAAEMEGKGFARLCKEHDVPWLVFRGVSDYGDPDKGDTWQAAAALAAAEAARIFIVHGYKRP